MPCEVTMPGTSFPGDETGHLLQWLKREGDCVRTGDLIAVVETRNAYIDVEAFHDGTLVIQLVPEGISARAGSTIAVIATGGEQIDDIWLRYARSQREPR